MELPPYRAPTLRHLGLGLLQRARIFLRRVGGVILLLTLALWLLASVPAPPPGPTGAAIEYSLAGTFARLLAPLLEPVGFNWQISVALVPGMAAREVVVSSLATVYALGGDGASTQALAGVIAHGWSRATAYALLAWFVFAPQCLSTLAAVRRETGRWSAAFGLAAWLFALAYAAAFVTYRGRKRVAGLRTWGLAFLRKSVISLGSERSLAESSMKLSRRIPPETPAGRG